MKGQWHRPDNALSEMPKYVYVASSWRCPMQIAVVNALEASGIECYDFRNPPNGTGFGWQEVMSSFRLDDQRCDVDEYISALNHPRSIEGFQSDLDAMGKADTFILVNPCGKSAHLELGWAIGMGKHTGILLENPVQPELMYKLADWVGYGMIDLLGWLGVSD